MQQYFFHLTLVCSPGDRLAMETVAALASAATTSAGITVIVLGLVRRFLEWIFDVYQNTYVPYFGVRVGLGPKYKARLQSRECGLYDGLHR
jgi:hypothetical protein